LAESYQKILIVKPSSLGDIVQALPVASALKRHWPKSEIHWVVFRPYQELLAFQTAVDRSVVIPFRSWKEWRGWWGVLPWLRSLRREGYELVLDLQGLLRSALISFFTRAPRRIGLWTAREASILFYTERILEPPASAQEKYLEFLRHLGIPPDPYDFGLVPPILAIAGLEGQSYIAIHPYARWRTKLWPYRYYQELVRLLPHHLFVVVGEGPWFPLHAENVVDLRFRLPLGQLAAVLHRARALVSTDSGPAHLGAALGTPTIVLFGATDWRKMRPVGKQVLVESYPVPCSPCQRRTCPQRHPMICLSGIEPSRVAARLRELCG
jgi:heptosyltransferase-1